MKKSVKIIVYLLITFIVIACIPQAIYAKGETSFTLNQNTEKALPGHKLDVTIDGINLDNLYAYEAVIAFDPAIVELDKAESKLDGFFISPKVNDGKMTIAFTKIGKKQGEQGNMPLCGITFNGKAQGNAGIKLVSVKVLDPNLTASVYNIKGFTDLEGYKWAKTEIEALASQGIIKGTSETTFSPGKSITRADFICLLIRALKLNADVEDNFSDVAQSDYFYKEIGIARKLGIVNGVGNNQLKPRENISRQDMMVAISRAMKLAGIKLDESTSDLSKFSDSGEVAPYALGAVAQLVKEGIVQGSGGRIDPRGTATRAETAVIMYRILNR